MTEKRFWKLSLLLPLVVPIIFSAIAYPLAAMGFQQEVLVPLILFGYYAILIGGIPYLLGCFLVLRFMRDKPIKTWRIAALTFPLGLTLLLVIVFIPFALVTQANPLVGIYYVPHVLTVGYSFVLLSFALRWLLIQTGRIQLHFS